MTHVPNTDDVRDIWVDYHLNPLPRAEGIALVPEYQAAFDAWLETIRADERAKVHVTSTGLSGHTDYAQVRSQVEADLRAKVEGLEVRQPWGPYGTDVVSRADVLALLDGSNDAATD